MAGYLTMTLICSVILRYIERRMDGTDSYELVQADKLAMSAGNYNHPHHGTPFAERSPEGKENAQRAEIQRKAGLGETPKKGKKGKRGGRQ